MEKSIICHVNYNHLLVSANNKNIMAIGKNMSVNKQNETNISHISWGECDNAITLKSCDTNAKFFTEVHTNHTNNMGVNKINTSGEGVWKFPKNDNDNESIISETDTNGGGIWR